MTRVIGIDPGTLSIDVCGLEDGRVFVDRSVPTSDASSGWQALLGVIEGSGPLDLIAGPSGYGLPLVSARAAADDDLRLACLAAEGDAGGIGGFRSLIRALARLKSDVLLTPGVVHLPTVPPHRKINRVDMGTADKVCAAALAIHDQATRRACAVTEVSLILLELGGAFTAALAVDGGRIVDGIGGSSGPIGIRAAGALDGEVAFLAGHVRKDVLFRGGAASVAGDEGASAESLADAVTPRAQIAWSGYLESAVKAVASLRVSVPHATDVVLSGRVAWIAPVKDEIRGRLTSLFPDVRVTVLRGFADVAKQAAQGAALVADGLAGGASASLVEAMAIRQASGTVLDHLHVISPEAARASLGMTGRSQDRRLHDAT
jgi:predicted butyrate kinase (DUF1464 family)